MAICSICGSESGDKTTVCAACGAAYHIDCWEYNGGCAIIGCGSNKKDEVADKKGGDGDKGVISGLELTVSSSSSPAVPEENDFVKRFIEPVYGDIVTLLEGTPNVQATDHVLLYQNANRKILPPPVVLRRLEKIRADWLEHYKKRLEERCGQDPHFPLVKEDPRYPLRKWGEFGRYFEPLRGWLGQFVDARSAMTKNPAPKEFYEILDLLDNIDESLQMGKMSQQVQRIREYAKRDGKLSSRMIMDHVFYDSTISVAIVLASVSANPFLLGLAAGTALDLLRRHKKIYRIEAQSRYSDYFSIEQNIHQVIPKLQVLYPSKDLCPSAARTMNLLKG